MVLAFLLPMRQYLTPQQAALSTTQPMDMFYFNIGFKSSSMLDELWAILKELEIALRMDKRNAYFFTDSLEVCTVPCSEMTTLRRIFITNVPTHEYENNIWKPNHRGVFKYTTECGASLNVYLTPKEVMTRIINCIKEAWNEEFDVISSQKDWLYASILSNIYNKPCYCNLRLMACVNRYRTTM